MSYLYVYISCHILIFVVVLSHIHLEFAQNLLILVLSEHLCSNPIISELNNSTNSGRSGHGPIKLISFNNINWLVVIHPMHVLQINFPTFVMRSSSLSAHCAPFFSAFFASERSLYILN